MPAKAQPEKSGGQPKNQQTEQCQPKAEQAKKKHANKKKTPVGQYAQKNCCLPPKWMPIAKAEVGTREIIGKKHNKRVLEYHSTSYGKYKDDETPWCGSFVNWVMKKAGYKKTIKIPERAKDWKKFGQKIPSPVDGAIAIKSRAKGGHVGFILGETPDKKNYAVLGGNQKNQVNVAKYSKKVWEAFVVPKDYKWKNCKLTVYTGTTVLSGEEE